MKYNCTEKAWSVFAAREQNAAKCEDFVTKNVHSLPFPPYRPKHPSELKIDKATMNSPLHIACAADNASLAKALLKVGHPVMALNKAGDTPMHAAAAAASAACVKILLDAARAANVVPEGALCAVEAVLGSRNRKGQTPLYVACEAQKPHGQVQACVARMLDTLAEDCGADGVDPNGTGKAAVGAIVRRKDGEACEAVFAAAAADHAAALRALVERGARVDARAQDGSLPLHAAAFHGSVDALRALIELGAPLEARNLPPDGSTALHYAVLHGDASHATDGPGPHVAASSSSDPSSLSDRSPSTATQRAEVAAMVGALCAAGADPNSRNTSGETPLHYACMTGDGGATRLLLRYGASTASTDVDESAPLHVTGNEGRIEAAMILLDFGADPQLQDGFGSTALQLAEQADMKDYIGVVAAYVPDEVLAPDLTPGGGGDAEADEKRQQRIAEGGRAMINHVMTHQHHEHRHGEHRHGEHRHGEHRHGEHHHGEHHEDAHGGEHHHGEHRHGEPHHGEPHHGEPHHGEHRHGEHRHGEHRHGEHHEGPPQGAPVDDGHAAHHHAHRH
jgi:ankyrin repeat protein